MRSSRSWLIAAALSALLGACSARGTGPESVEVGGQCDPNGDFEWCETECLEIARTCVFRCKSDADCPRGSVCTSVHDGDGDNVCLPLCSTVRCDAYEQNLCCGSVQSISGRPESVCYTSNDPSFVCSGL